MREPFEDWDEKSGDLTLKQAIEDLDEEQLDARAWVAFGRIAEQFGYDADAQLAFLQAKKKGPGDEEMTGWAMRLIPAGR